MNYWELLIVMAMYSIAAVRQYNAGHGPEAWIWFTYAAGIPGFILMRMNPQH